MRLHVCFFIVFLLLVHVWEGVSVDGVVQRIWYCCPIIRVLSSFYDPFMRICAKLCKKIDDFLAIVKEMLYLCPDFPKLIFRYY
jgi:hypothetical protein